MTLFSSLGSLLVVCFLVNSLVAREKEAHGRPEEVLLEIARSKQFNSLSLSLLALIFRTEKNKAFLLEVVAQEELSQSKPFPNNWSMQ
jgi:hypothetical protein